GNTTISPIPAGATSSVYQNFSGSDSTTGYTWPMTFWGANSVSTGTHPISGGANLVGAYLNNTIESVPGRTGAATNAFKMFISGPTPGFCCVQDTFQISGMSQQVGDFYVRYWMKLNPEFLSQVQANGSNFWRTALELKTYTDYRIATFIYGNG